MNTVMLSTAVMLTGLFPMSGLFGHMGNNDFNMMGNNNSSMMSGFTSNRNNDSRNMMNGYSYEDMMGSNSRSMMNGYSYNEMMDDDNGYNCH